MIYLGFLLASQVGFRKKMVGMFPSAASRQEALEVPERARRAEGYLWVQAVTGAMIRAVVGADAAWGFRTLSSDLRHSGTSASLILVLGGAVALRPAVRPGPVLESHWPALILSSVFRPCSSWSAIWSSCDAGDNQNIDPIVVLLALASLSKLWAWRA